MSQGNLAENLLQLSLEDREEAMRHVQNENVALRRELAQLRGAPQESGSRRMPDAGAMSRGSARDPVIPGRRSTSMAESSARSSRREGRGGGSPTSRRSTSSRPTGSHR